MSESKVCVVTGASSGIGRAFAVRLDSLGYKVCLLGRRRDKLQEVAAALSAGETCAVQCSAVQCSAV
jgi:short-subunit dehydrogenase